MILATGDQIVAVVPMPGGDGDLLVFTMKGEVYRFGMQADGVTPRLTLVSAAGAAIQAA